MNSEHDARPEGGQKHTVETVDMPTPADQYRYRWECSCGAAGTAPGWVAGAAEFHLLDGDTITYRYPAHGE